MTFGDVRTQGTQATGFGEVAGIPVNTIRWPDGHREPMSLTLRRMFSAYEALLRDFAGALGTTAREGECLMLLLQQGSQTMSGVAAALDLSPSAVTALVDRLEALDLVRRVYGVDDRRRVYVEATPEARERADEALGPMAPVRETLHRLPSRVLDDLAIVAECLEGSRRY